MELTQEQINNLIEALNKVEEIVKEAWEAITEICNKIANAIISTIDFDKVKKIYKYVKIYIKTHNQRIKKKQLKMIFKLLE